MKFFLKTFGCRVNQVESQALFEEFQRAGWSQTPHMEEADLCLLNTCTVTHQADKDVEKLIRQILRRNPASRLVLTGCYAAAHKEHIRQTFPQAEIVGKYDLGKTLFNKEDVCWTVSGHEGHSRAFIKIQDGCDRFCSYCIIPYARGRSRSASLERVRSVSRAFAANGYREIVLVGINLSAFGKDSGEGDLADAVAAASEPAGIVRVRLGSLEPDHLTPDLLERLSACRKLCGQFHISLQSGCDSVLRRMNRHYTAEEYDSLTQRLRAGFPDCSLTTDVICGFPGESEEEFAETVAFVKKIGFEKVHIFPYSPRSGTSAARRDGQIPKHEKQKRCAYLAKITENSRTAFFAARLGKIYDVLFETQKNGLWHGYTENYIPVAVKNEGTESLRGKILPVRLSALSSDGCIGERLPDETENL